MATTTDDVLIGAPDRSTTEGVVGYAYTCDALATDLPETTSAALPASAEDLGYVSEDGVSIETDRGVEVIRDWNLDDVRQLLTEHSAILTFTIISWTVEGLRAYFGAENVDDSGDEITVRINSRDIANRGWIFNMKDLDRKRRIIIPNGAIESQGELTFMKSEQTPLEISVRALVDGAGEKIYIRTQKAPVTP